MSFRGFRFKNLMVWDSSKAFCPGDALLDDSLLFDTDLMITLVCIMGDEMFMFVHYRVIQDVKGFGVSFEILM